MQAADFRELPVRAWVETDGFHEMERTPEGYVFGGIRLRYDGGIHIERDKNAPYVKRFKLRWVCGNRGVERVLRDTWQRNCGDIGWETPCPERELPWYFMTREGTRYVGVGVKTGPDAFIFWQTDASGVTLWLDVRCGGDGAAFDTLDACELVTYEGEGTAFDAAQTFAGLMCPHPKLPTRPVFGANNWYYAYGNITRESVHNDAALMGSLVDGCMRPYMVIDDGWQKNRRKGYIGGPWVGNDRFGDMGEVAEDIRREGCIPGLWMRPTLSEDITLPESWRLERPVGIQPDTGFILDPSVPEVLLRIGEDVARVAGWGYQLIKHDFSSYDLSGMTDSGAGHQLTPEGWHFRDRTRTTAQVVKALYRTVQDAAGGAYVMGCNTYNHLTAGIHELMRSGGDTSGRVWEITRRSGIGTLALRLYQNGRFFMTDADCAAFTEKVPTQENLRFAELVARSGTALFSSIAPGRLTAPELVRLRGIYETAKEPHTFEPLDWERTTCPCEYLCDGQRLCYDWFGDAGVRTFYTWFG